MPSHAPSPRLPAPAGSTLNHWPFPWKHLGEAYAYLLTHCGTPCVFYDHFYFDEGLKKVGAHGGGGGARPAAASAARPRLC